MKTEREWKWGILFKTIYGKFLYKKGNLDAVKEYLDSKLESFKEKYKEMNIEGYWTTFKSHLFNAMDQYIPS
jgi:hypothetical protein